MLFHPKKNNMKCVIMLVLFIKKLKPKRVNDFRITGGGSTQGSCFKICYKVARVNQTRLAKCC